MTSPGLLPVSMKRGLGQMLRRSLLCAFLAMLAIAETASATAITVDLEDFLIFSGGGWVSTADAGTGGDAGFETDLSGASLYYGNIGSNYDLTSGASDTFILGSVYAGKNVELRQYTQIGSDGTKSIIDLEQPILGAAPPPPVDGSGFPTFPLQLERVVANGEASIGNSTTKIFGSLDAGIYTDDWTISGTTTIGAGADTFVRISMQGTSFVHATNTYADQLLSGAGDKTINPGHHGDLTTTGDQTILLRSGDYYFDLVNTVGDAVTLKIDLTSGAPINIYVVGDANFGGQENRLMVKGPGMTEYKLISDPTVKYLAGLINWETRGTFTLGGGPDDGTWGSIWGGTVYSTATGTGVDMRQRIDWYGALWAYDSISLLDHSRYNYVPYYENGGGGQNGVIPEPSTFVLLGSGLVGLFYVGRRKSRK